MTPPLKPCPFCGSAPTKDALIATLNATDDELSAIQRIADEHLRGKIRTHAKEITLPLADLLAITCIASSLQQDIRCALDPSSAIEEEANAARRRHEALCECGDAIGTHADRSGMCYNVRCACWEFRAVSHD